MSFESIPESLKSDLAPEPLPVANAWRELVGNIVPEDLARHEPQDGGFLLSHPKQLLEADNCFEAAVAEAVGGRVMEPVLQTLTLVFFLGEIPGDGDCLMLQITNSGDTCHVVNWSHEEGFFTGPVAWDIPSALRVMHVAREMSDTEERKQALAPALGRVNASNWPFSYEGERLVEDGVLEDEGELHLSGEAPRNLLDVVQPRAWWLAKALTGQGVSGDDIKNQLEWTPEKALGGPHLAKFPPTGLYWLWRSFFLAEAWLGDILAATRNSESRLVRDAVTLIEALSSGARKEVGGVDLIAVRERIGQVVAKLKNPFPPALEAHKLKYVRDDSLVSQLTAEVAALPEGPPIAPGQPLEPARDARKTVLAVSPSGRFLVSGHRRHPRAGKHPSIPNHIPSVFEIDQTGKVLMTCDASQVTQAHYVGEDQFVLSIVQGFSVYERHGVRAVATQTFNGVQEGTLFADGGRTIVRFGGFYDHSAKQRRAHVIQVFRIDGGVLKLMSKAELTLHQAALDGMQLVVGDAEQGVAYRTDLSVLAEHDFQQPALGKSWEIRPKLDAREGPEIALAALNPVNDWAFPMPDGKCVIYKYNGTTFDFWVGDDEGARPFEPAIGGMPVDYQIFDDTHAALIGSRSQVWEADFSTGKATLLFESEGSDPLAIVGRGLAQIIGTDLVLHRPTSDGYGQTRVSLGDDCKLHAALMNGRVLAVQAQGSPLVLLGVSSSGVHLLAALDPQSPRAGHAVEQFENPRGVSRLELVKDNDRLVLRGLEASLKRLAELPTLDALPSEPWTVRAIE